MILVIDEVRLIEQISAIVPRSIDQHTRTDYRADLTYSRVDGVVRSILVVECHETQKVTIGPVVLNHLPVLIVEDGRHDHGGPVH